MITTIGVPVYYHYCGGELETIHYVLKGKSCCAGDDEAAGDSANDCCRNEHHVLKSSVDFTMKDLSNYAFVKSCFTLSYFSPSFFITNPVKTNPILCEANAASPPDGQQQRIVSISVLRI